MLIYCYVCIYVFWYIMSICWHFSANVECARGKCADGTLCCDSCISYCYLFIYLFMFASLHAVRRSFIFAQGVTCVLGWKTSDLLCRLSSWRAVHLTQCSDICNYHCSPKYKPHHLVNGRMTIAIYILMLMLVFCHFREIFYLSLR